MRLMNRFEDARLVDAGRALGVESSAVASWPDLVSAVVRFANGDSAPDPLLFFERKPDEPARFYYPSWMSVPSWKKRGALSEQVARGVGTVVTRFGRQEAKRILSAAAQPGSALGDLLRERYLDRKLGAVIVQPVFRFAADGSPSMSEVMLGPPNPALWVISAAMFIAAHPKVRIGHCQYSKCERFFVVDSRGKQGKPARHYCPGTNHGEKAKYENNPSTPRSRKSRAKQRKGKHQ